MKKLMYYFTMGIFLMTLGGCIALVAGGVAGVGTAVWLSGKLTQEFHAPYAQTVNAAKEGLRSLNLEITKETQEEDVTQLKGKYSDNKELWVDIRKVTDNSTKVEIRVGAVSSDKAASDKILKAIQRHL